MKEADLKLQIKDYLDIQHIFSFPILQGLGAYKGIPDRIIHFRGQVVYLEVKTAKGKLSPAQIEFREQCERDRIQHYVIRSIEDLISIVS